MEALRRLAEGAPVTAVALDLGYATPSAFAYMFRRALGTPPSRFLPRRTGAANAGLRPPSGTALPLD